MVSDQFHIFLGISVTSTGEKKSDVFRENFSHLHCLTIKEWQAKTDKSMRFCLLLKFKLILFCSISFFLYCFPQTFKFFTIICWINHSRQKRLKTKTWVIAHSNTVLQHYITFTQILSRNPEVSALDSIYVNLHSTWIEIKQHKPLKNIANPNQIFSSLRTKVLY